MASHRDSGHAWKRDCANHGWGFVAADVADPPRCITGCRERFLRAMLPKDETFERLCEVLEDKDRMDREQPFRTLYCCDAQLCGVDNLGAGGKDPNVNWFINVCQDIGYHSIVDPGPPDSAYTCNQDTGNGDDGRCQREGSDAVTDAVVSSDNVSDSTTAPSTGTPTSVPMRSSTPDQTYSTISDPSLAASLEPSNAEKEVEDDGGLSTGVKVTIGLTTVIGIAAIVALAICLLRRRSRRGDIRRQIKHPNSPMHAESPTPLVSPTFSTAGTDGVPLTPPARLRERRLLPTLTNQRATSEEGSPKGRPGFPMSPLYSPATSKMTPRHERTPKIRHGGSSIMVPRIVMTTPDGGRTNQDGTPSSFGRESPTPTSNAGSANGSPTRPSRSHEHPLKISELVSPGPPPTRALPSTPPNGSGSPTSSKAHADEGRASPAASPPRATQGAALTSESRELCHLTEDCARESHNSWGSWGGGGPGVVAGSLPARGRNTPSPVMEEVDLERLGGRY